MKRGFQRTVISFLTILLVATAVGAFIFVQDARREFRHMQRKDSQLVARLAEVDGILEERREFLRRLEEDPEFLERVVREQLRLTRPGEIVFLFPGDEAAPVD